MSDRFDLTRGGDDPDPGAPVIRLRGRGRSRPPGRSAAHDDVQAFCRTTAQIEVPESLTSPAPVAVGMPGSLIGWKQPADGTIGSSRAMKHAKLAIALAAFAVVVVVVGLTLNQAHQGTANRPDTAKLALLAVARSAPAATNSLLNIAAVKADRGQAGRRNPHRRPVRNADRRPHVKRPTGSPVTTSNAAATTATATATATATNDYHAPTEAASGNPTRNTPATSPASEPAPTPAPAPRTTTDAAGRAAVATSSPCAGLSQLGCQAGGP